MAPQQPDEDLLAVAIHELRDPLSGLVNAADVLRQSTGLDQQARWAAGVVDRQARCLVAVMEDLSITSDLARGRLELQFETLDLEPLIRRSIEGVRPELALRRQELRLETGLGALPVWGDGGRLSQVLSRLLEHAVRQADVGAVLTVTARAAGEMVSVALRWPVGAEAPEPSERRLGLILIRRLIALHGGTLRDPTADGAFELHLPIGVSVPAVAPAVATATAVPRRVLVVDDEHDSAQALAMALERRGHRVRVVHNGRAALEVLPTFQPDAVLMDIGLPGPDGLEIARTIRATPGNAHLILIAATGLGWSDDRQRSLQAGFDRHLVKPLALEDVEAALAQARFASAPPAGRS